jgi:hypothetical protein
MRTTVFSPEDLDLVKDSPGVRRDFLDDALVAITPSVDALLTEIERVLKQRNALLKQSNGRITSDIATTLDVWDEKFSTLGTELGEHRARLVATISPEVSRAYEELAEQETPIAMIYEPEWRRNGLASELASHRNDDIRRGSSTVGPHRDDVAERDEGEDVVWLRLAHQLADQVGATLAVVAMEATLELRESHVAVPKEVRPPRLVQHSVARGWEQHGAGRVVQSASVASSPAAPLRPSES